jgi:hypothetical protein
MPDAHGLKTLSITGAFIWPPTIPHLYVNALNIEGAVVAVCLMPVAICGAWAVLAFLSNIGNNLTFMAEKGKRETVLKGNCYTKGGKVGSAG